MKIVCIAYYLNTSRRKTVIKEIESKEKLLKQKKNNGTKQNVIAVFKAFIFTVKEDGIQ